MKVGAGCSVLGGTLLLLVAVQAQVLSSSQSLHGHVRPVISSGRAQRLGDLPLGQRLNVSIQLAPRNQAALNDLLTRLYDPRSPDYRHFLSVAQFADAFSPSAADYQATVDWAQARGLTVTKPFANRLVVPVSGTVAQIDSAFHVTMSLYQHPTEARAFYSTDREPSLDLAVPVAHIAGLDDYSIPKPLVTRGAVMAQAVGSGPGGAFLSSDMRAAYYGGTTLTGAGQTVGLVEFDGYNLSDVNLMFSNAGQTYGVPVDNVLLDGATGAACQLIPNNCSDVEQVIDIAQAIGMAPNLNQVRVYIGNSDPDILSSIAGEDIAQEVSISWTWLPDDPSTDDIFFQEMAAQGQSVFAASGDYGEFDPLINNFYPAEDAWVTSVGGTDLVTTAAGGAWSSEVGWSNSGGGVSPDGIPIPSWQLGVGDNSSNASATLRNVPDVAMEADTDNYYCNLGTCGGTEGGTSFAAPRWAGFIALANEQASTMGEGPVGFANPALYAIGDGANYNSDFHDIVSGNDETEGGCCGQQVYYAVVGYDLVTGWGSPTGQNLIDALAPVVAPGFALTALTKSLTIEPGGDGTSTIAIRDIGGFTGNVEFSVSGLPSGVTASWSTNPASTSSLLTLTAANNVMRGSYLITVTGVAGSISATTSVAVQVNAPGFTVVAWPATLNLVEGQSISTTVTVTDYAGFSGPVNLSVQSALPEGVTASWSPDPATGTSVLTLTANASAPLNTRSMVTIAGASGNLTATSTVALNFTAPLFQLGFSPYPSNIVQGGTITSTVTVLPMLSLANPVSLSAVELPPGVSAGFNPVTTADTSTLTLTASNSAPLGTYGMQLEGASLDCCDFFDISQPTITSSPTFNLTASSLALTITQGGSVTDTIGVSPLNGFSGFVTLSTPGICCGISSSLSTNPTSGSSVVTLTAAANADVSEPHAIEVLGTSGSQTAHTVLYLAVKPQPGFNVVSSNAYTIVSPGGTAPDTITVIPQAGFTGSVNLSLTSSLPNGVTASFGTNPTSGNSVLTFAASSSAQPGVYSVTLTGTANGNTVSIPIGVTVSGSFATSTGLSISSMGWLEAGAPYRLVALVSPVNGTAIPSGNVLFTIGSTQQSVYVDSGGAAIFNGTAPTTPGPLTISANYQGGSGFAASTSNTLNEMVATTMTWNPAKTIVFGDAGGGVLNASANVAGSFSYTATPTSGSPIAIPSTSGLAPGSYTITANFTPTSNQYTAATGYSTLTVSGESVWVLDSGSGLGELTGGGVALTSSPYPSASLAEAIDSGGNIWSIGRGTPLLEKTSQVGTEQLSVSSGTGGLDLPAAVAIDGNSQVWVVNGNGSVSEFSNTGTALSPSSGFTDRSLSMPSGVAVDLAGSVWITNQGNNSVTRILGGAAPAAPIATAGANKTTGSRP